MKKKVIYVIVTVLFLAIVGAGCFFAYKHFTGDKDDKKPPEVNENYKGMFTLETLPKVDGSTATQPLIDAFMRNFTSEEVKDIPTDYSKTHQAYVKLIDKKVDLIVVTSPSEDELKLASDKGVELEVTKVVNEGFIFFVNGKNPVDNLKLSQIVDIYSGKTNYWNEVGGNKEKIIPYQRPENSGSQTGMLDLVMKGVKLREPVTSEVIGDMGSIIDIVANYDNNISGLGYSYYYFATSMYKNDNLKFLSVDGVKPTYETIQNEEYPIMTAYYIVTRKNDSSENTLKLKEAMLSKTGQQVAKDAGYVPVK